MKRTIEAARGFPLVYAFALVSGLAALSGIMVAQAPSPAAIARISEASIQEDGALPGRFLYRLLVAYPGKRPDKEPKVDIGKASGISVESVLVKPYRGSGSEILIEFSAPPGGDWGFPGLRLSWDSELLLVPPRKAAEAAAPQGEREAANPPPSSAPGAGEPPWKNAKLPARASSALAVGNISVSAKLDRESLGIGEIAYLEILLEGKGDFARAGTPRVRSVSGGVSLGEPRRYPGYDPASGEGSLLFRFPLRASSPGLARIRAEAYPVYDPEEGELLPGMDRLLELRAFQPPPDPNAASAEPKSEKRGTARFFWLASMISALAFALCIGSYGIIQIILRRSGRGASSKRGKVAVFASLCFLMLGAASALVLAFQARPGTGFRLGQGARIFVVPSEKSRSWTEAGARARILGKSEAADGSSWYRIVLEDSSTGWIRAEDAKGADPP